MDEGLIYVFYVWFDRCFLDAAVWMAGLWDTDVTAHDNSVYSEGKAGGEDMWVYKRLCDPSHLKTPMHLLLLFRLGQVCNSQP